MKPAVSTGSFLRGLCPGRGTRLRAALVVAIATVHGLAADRSEGNFGRDAAAVACHADHGALAATAVAVAGHLSFVAAILTALGLIRETALCVKCLFVLAENELLAAVGAVQSLVIECIHEPLIS